MQDTQVFLVLKQSHMPRIESSIRGSKGRNLSVYHNLKHPFNSRRGLDAADVIPQVTVLKTSLGEG